MEALSRAMAEAPVTFSQARSVDIVRSIADVSPDKVAQRFVEVVRTICLDARSE
jgi:hypothetical protein